MLGGLGMKRKLKLDKVPLQNRKKLVQNKLSRALQNYLDTLEDVTEALKLVSKIRSEMKHPFLSNINYKLRQVEEKLANILKRTI